MNIYKVIIIFKNGKDITIEAESEVNPLETLQTDWHKYKNLGMVPIGDYIFVFDEIRYIKVESDRLVERTGSEVQSNREKEQ